MLVTLLIVAVSTGAAMAVLVLRLSRRNRIAGPIPILVQQFGQFSGFLPVRPTFMHRPSNWLAVRSRNLLAVQEALGLQDAKPCTWIEGITGEQKLFIAPPVLGWILVIGAGLPDPGEDVDACFRFVVELSRKLGHVQFFSANRVLGQHAWVRAEAGRVVRAYAWAGNTLWNQGLKTAAELELGLKCYHYLETPEAEALSQWDIIAANTEKVPLLAARWSLDPAGIDERLFEHAHGIAGEPTRLY